MKKTHIIIIVLVTFVALGAIPLFVLLQPVYFKANISIYELSLEFPKRKWKVEEQAEDFIQIKNKNGSSILLKTRRVDYNAIPHNGINLRDVAEFPLQDGFERINEIKGSTIYRHDNCIFPKDEENNKFLNFTLFGSNPSGNLSYSFVDKNNIEWTIIYSFANETSCNDSQTEDAINEMDEIVKSIQIEEK
ncbi:hypothetical protein JW796_00900 [Candidatus Dojkabacteria bacterium]|nr:hypothetical protein [Candidatus Dojkabacteria bacterium]